MTEARDGSVENPGTRPPQVQSARSRLVLGLACLAVLAFYAWLASARLWQTDAAHPENAYYNLLTEGFRAGQLSLIIKPPPALAQLADPYDPAANRPYRLHDVSYYRGKFYLYFGVTPVLVLFWPFAALTGQPLLHQQATMIFCAVGFLASAALIVAMGRRWFPCASTATVATGVLAVGLVNLVPVLLGRAQVYEVAISYGYTFSMVALWALWHALHDPKWPHRWLAAASLAYGLAVGARPSLLPGAAMLLIPIFQEWRSAHRGGRAGLLVAAFAPIATVGVVLLAYNAARFGSPWEFGQRYQLASVKVSAVRLFSPAYLWTNVRLYFFQPLRWSGDFPFAQGAQTPPLPSGHLGTEGAFGALTNLPFLWLAGAILLIARADRGPESFLPLRWFLTAVAVMFTLNAATVCGFAGACDRYQVDFLPALSVLAVVGLLALESAATTRAQLITLRIVAALLLAASAATNWLASYKSSPEQQIKVGYSLGDDPAQAPAAEAEFRLALATLPDSAAAHHGLALILARQGRLADAIAHFRAAIRSAPNFAAAHNGLGVTLLQMRQPAEALGAFTAALQAAPEFAEAHYDCAMALLQLGRTADAIAQLEETLRLRPDFPGASASLDRTRRQQTAR